MAYEELPGSMYGDTCMMLLEKRNGGQTRSHLGSPSARTVMTVSSKLVPVWPSQ